jgi:hypothetical protein
MLSNVRFSLTRNTTCLIGQRVGKVAASTKGGRLDDAEGDDDDGLAEAARVAAVELGGAAPLPLQATAMAIASAPRSGAEGFGRVPIGGV